MARPLKGEKRSVPPPSSDRGRGGGRGEGRRWGRALLLYPLLVLAVLFLFVLVGGFVLLRSDAGQGWIRTALVEAASDPEGLGIAIGELDGALPGEIVLRDLALSDPQGVWLTADRARLAWDPLALLAGRLELEAVEAGTLAVERAPNLPPGPDETAEPEPFTLPEPPLEIALRRLAIERLELGAGLIGEPAALTVTGRAAAEQQAGFTAALQVDRVDGGEGGIDLEARLTPEEVLAIDLEAREPASGVVARLIGQPDLGALSVTLQGEAPLRDWQGRLEAAVEGQGQLGADLRLAAAPEGAYRFGVEGQGSASLPPDLLPDPALTDLVAEGLEFSVAGLYGEDGLVTLEMASLTSDALALDAAGTIATAGPLRGDLKAQASLLDPDLLAGLVEGLSLPGARVGIALAGPLDSPAVTLDASAEAVRLPGLEARTLSAHLEADPEGPLGGPDTVLPFRLDATLDSIALEGQERLAPFLEERARLTARGELALDSLALDLEALTLQSPLATLDAGGEIALQEPSGQLTLEARLPDLARFAPLAGGLSLTGGVTLSGEASVPQGSRQVVADLAVETAGLSLGVPAVDALLGRDPSLTADLVYDPEEGARLEPLVVRAANMEARLTGSTDAAFETLVADLEARLPALAPLGEALETPLAGSVTVTARAEGPIADPQARAEIAGRGLAAAGQEIGALDLAVTARDLASAPAGRLDGRLDAPQGELDFGSDFRLEGERLALSDLSAGTRGVAVTGAVDLNLATTLAEGRIQAEAGDLGPLLALAGQEGEGSASLDLTLEAAQGAQAATLSARLSDLVYLAPPEPGEAPPEDEVEAANEAARYTLDSLTVELRSSDVQALQAEGEIVLQELNADRLYLEQARITAEGGAQEVALTAAARGRLDKPLSLDAEARLRRDGEAIQVTMTRLEGGALGLPYQLRGQTELALEGERMAVEGLDLTVAGGRLTGSAARQGPAIDADLVLEELALRPFGELAGLPDLEGFLQARLEVSGAAPRPTGSFTLDVRDLTTAQTKEVPPIAAEARADWQGGQLALDATVGGFAEQPATLEASLPLTLDPETLQPVLPPSSPLQGRMAWAGPVEQLWALVPIADQTLRGDAAIAAQVGGTLGSPDASGSVTLSDGRYENIPTGTILDDLELEVTLEGRQAVVRRLSASDGGSGRLEASGQAELLPTEGFPFELQASLTDMTLVRRDEVTGAIGGEVTVSGTTRSSTVTGDFTTRGMEIRIPNQLPPEVVDLEVKEVNVAAIGREPVEEDPNEPEPPSDISLDVGVRLPGQVFVRGRGLDSEWQGNIQVGGRADAPTLNGELSLVRGQLTLLNQTFNLNRGRITFGGLPGEIDPLLDIVAQTETDELTVTVTLSGSASRPSVALSSQPSLPQDEILSRILFGKATTELSAFEAVQLANAAAELSGRGSTVGILDFARNLVGVDVLRVGGGEGDTASPTVEAGKYVTDKVFVGVEQGTAAGSGKVGVEVEITPNILLESDVGQSGSSEVGVKFKWDY